MVRDNVVFHKPLKSDIETSIIIMNGAERHENCVSGNWFVVIGERTSPTTAIEVRGRWAETEWIAAALPFTLRSHAH